MSRVVWPLRHNRPSVRIDLKLEVGGQTLARALLADSGAGSSASGFDLISEEDDCLHCGGFPIDPINIGGAYQGSFPRYDLIVQVPELEFLGALRVVGVWKAPP